MKDAYCSHCGEKHVVEAYPKTCPRCGMIAWNNPLPVVVCVQPIVDPARATAGLAIAQRAIEPKLGCWTLLGGHMEVAETVEAAAAREFSEETGLAIGANPRIRGSHANQNGHILIVVEAEPISHQSFRAARLCSENAAFDVMWSQDQVELGFPIHRLITADWFARAG